MNHDNIGIVELRPEAFVVAKDTAVQFSITIANFSASERKNVFLSVKVKGSENNEATQQMPPLAPGRSDHTFRLSFNELGFNTITADLQNEDEQNGLRADNLRYAVVDVRNQVSVLTVDGNGDDGKKPGGDTFHLYKALHDNHGYRVEIGSMADLENGYHIEEIKRDQKERHNLQDYPSLYLLNVPQLSDKALHNVLNYVAGGGSVAFFLGDKVRPEFYNRALYEDGAGLFPAPLAPRPKRTTPGDPSKPLTEEERKVLLNDGHFKIFLRDPKHPIFAPVYDYQFLFRFLIIDRYFAVDTNYKGKRFAPGKDVEELVTLPNAESVDPFKLTAQELVKELPIDDPAYEKYRPALEAHRRRIFKALGESLYDLASAFNGLLTDTGVANDPQKPSMVEFWERPEPAIKDLHSRIADLRTQVQYGDPLVMTKKYGKGRVVAFFTTAGRAWNDWPGGCDATWTYPMVIYHLQRYLGGVGENVNRTLGEPVSIALDPGRYQDSMSRRFESMPRSSDARDPAAPAGVTTLQDLGTQFARTDQKDKLLFDFNEARRAGVYYFDFQPRDLKEPVERKAFVYNVDTAAEGDLRRAQRETLLSQVQGSSPGPGRASVYLNDMDSNLGAIKGELNIHPFPESPWFFLLMLLVLITEQALAVHLSFHLKGSEAQRRKGCRNSRARPRECPSPQRQQGL